MRLTVDGVTKSFGSKDVLKGASMNFDEGRIYGLLGRNGSGKTTLFNCLSGELPMDSGSATLERNGTAKPLEQNDICYVLSSPVLPDFFTGWEFVRFYCDIHGDVQHTPDEYLDIVGMGASDRHRLIKGYSHGMKNKLQMLCFIISKPPVILLDEPLTNLDPVVSLEIKKLLKTYAKEHVVLFSTHILELARDLCDEIVILSGGTLTLVDSEQLGKPDFEEKVIELLKSDGDDDE